MDEQKIGKAKTKLDENASIYSKRETLTEKQKLSEMKFIEKLKYLKEYYLVRTLVIIAIIALSGSLLYTMFSPKPEVVLSISIIDSPFFDEDIAAIQEAMTKRLVADEDKQEVFIDTEYYMSADAYSNQMKLMTRLAAEQIDVLIARKSYFTGLIEGSMLMPLEGILPEDMKKEFSDDLIYGKTKETGVNGQDDIYGDEMLYGITLSQFETLHEFDLSEDPYVFGLAANAKQKENAMELIRYFQKEGAVLTK